jgi:hypothetical protein
MSCGQVAMSPPPHVMMFPFRLNILLLWAFYEPPTYAAGLPNQSFLETQKTKKIVIKLHQIDLSSNFLIQFFILSIFNIKLYKVILI